MVILVVHLARPWDVSSGSSFACFQVGFWVNTCLLSEGEGHLRKTWGTSDRGRHHPPPPQPLCFWRSSCLPPPLHHTRGAGFDQTERSNLVNKPVANVYEDQSFFCKRKDDDDDIPTMLGYEASSLSKKQTKNGCKSATKPLSVHASQAKTRCLSVRTHVLSLALSL